MEASLIELRDLNPNPPAPKEEQIPGNSYNLPLANVPRSNKIYYASTQVLWESDCPQTDIQAIA